MNKTCPCGKPVPSYRSASDHCSAKCQADVGRVVLTFPVPDVRLVPVERLDGSLEIAIDVAIRLPDDPAK